MDKTEESNGGKPMLNAGNGPWDFPDDGAASGPPNGGAGSAEASNDGEDAPQQRPANPWDPESAIPTKPRSPSLDELFKRPGGGGGGWRGLPQRPDGKSWWPLIVGGLALLWVGATSVHQIDAGEAGVVTFFGKYSRTRDSGIALTLPAPIESMTKITALRNRVTSVGSKQPSNENLILTRDKNLIDMAYQVRWAIRRPDLYLFQIDDPKETVQQVAESAMRSVIANFDFDQANGPGRGAISSQVRQQMQQILDGYHAGVTIISVTIDQSDAPPDVKPAVDAVTAAKQQREKYVNDARAEASKITEEAKGNVAGFDRMYEQYRLAPEVTKRRLYYETMEEVLGPVDKTVVEGGVMPYLPLPGIARSKEAAPNEITVTGRTK